MSSPKLLFAIPAFNEAGTIGSTVRQLLQYGEVLVVDDGSTDNTAFIAEDVGATVCRHPTNFGYDQALLTSLVVGQQLSCDWLLTIDADGQHQVDDVEKFMFYFNKADLIIGKRPVASMRFGERLLGVYYLKKHGIRDPLSGLKAYRTRMLCEIEFSLPNPLPSYGLDILDAILHSNPKAKVTEVPITIKDRQGSPRIGNSWKVNKRLLHNLYKRLRHELC